jgi:hypothetical protein
MIKNDDIQVTAKKMAAMILENSVCGLGETVQGILCYIVEQQDQYPAAATFMEAVLQNLCDAVEPSQLIA